MRNNDDEIFEVVETEYDEETAEKARNSKIILTSATILAIAIIFVSCGYNKKVDTLIKENEVSQTVDYEEENTELESEYTETEIEEPIEETAKETVEEAEETYEVVEETNNNSEFTGKEINYNNVSTFYNQIVEYQNQHSDFANSFQSEEDVKNLINFIYSFDQLYSLSDTATTISSQKQYDEIISDYYKSCVKYNVDANLSSLFEEGSYINNKLGEAESLANNLRNGKGNDYTISNQYYTWFGVNLCDDRTKIKENIKNAPLIDLLREQFEQYRYVGNMLEARKYQKNDSLDIDGLDVYYGYKYEDGIDYEENQNSFSCPDWGIDNVVSKSENIEETKLLTSMDGSKPFEQVDEAFEYVLNNGKAR